MGYKLNTEQIEQDFMNIEYDTYEDTIIAYKGGIFYEISTNIPKISISDTSFSEVSVYSNTRGEVKSSKFGIVSGKKFIEAIENIKANFSKYYLSIP